MDIRPEPFEPPAPIPRTIPPSRLEIEVTEAIFLRDPDLCLMDEPSSTLDAQHEKELLHTLKTEYGKKISCFNVSGFIQHF